MIDRLEQRISSYVFYKFNKSRMKEFGTFYMFYLNYRLRYTKFLDKKACNRCNGIINQYGIQINVKFRDEAERLNLHHSCLDEIVDSGHENHDDPGLIKDFSITNVPI